MPSAPSPASTTRPLRRGLRALGFMIRLGLAVVVTLAALEIGVRLLAPVDRFEYIPNTFDPVCQIRQEPHARGFIICPEYRMEIRTNGGGLRENREIPYAKPAGQTRILCLGDSFTSGFGVTRAETFAGLIENDLDADVDSALVIDAGVAGTGTAQQLAWFDLEGRRYDPDLVLLTPCANDFADNTASALFTLAADSTLVQHPAVQSRTLQVLRWLRRVPGYTTFFARSHLLNAIKQGFARWYHERLAARASGEAPSDAVLTHEDKLTDALLLRLRERCEQQGAALVVMPVPALPGSRPAEQQVDTLYRFLAQQGFAVVDLRAAFAEARGRGEALEYPVDGHWTPAGHRLAAAEFLASCTTTLAATRDRATVPSIPEGHHKTKERPR